MVFVLPTKIGIDLDDVLGDFVPAFLEYHNKVYETSFVLEDVFSYRIWEVLGVARDEAMRRVAEYSERHIMEIQPVVSARESVEALSQGYELHVITARPEIFVEKTSQWLEMHFPKMFSGIHSVEYLSTHRTKGDVCDELGIYVVIDDFFDNAASCIAPGRKVLLFNAPWNRSMSDLPAGMKRVCSWEDALVEIG